VATIGDLIPNVVSKLSNRTVPPAKCVKWIQDAVKDITASFSFTELQLKGPTVQLTINESAYDKRFFLNSNDIDATNIDSFFFYISGNSGTGYNLKYRTVPTIEAMMKIAGQPVYWSRHGKVILLAPMPQQAYYVFQRYQERHPWTDNPINDTIRIADDWLEIVEYAAAMRGAWDERMYDYNTQVKTLLYGNAEFQRTGSKGEGQPGLIHAKCSQQSRDMSNNERQIQPRVARY
jgi:hypothetical protein